MADPTEVLDLLLDRPAGEADFRLELPWPLAGDQERASGALSEGVRGGALLRLVLRLLPAGGVHPELGYVY